MRPIGYFLLIFFSTLTNIIDSMIFVAQDQSTTQTPNESFRNFVSPQALYQQQEAVSDSYPMPFQYENPQETAQVLLQLKAQFNNTKSSIPTTSTVVMQTALTPTQKFLPSSKKRKIDESTHFALECHICHKLFPSYEKNKTKKFFKMHAKKEHKNLTEQEIKGHIQSNLREPPKRRTFKLACPYYPNSCSDILQLMHKNSLKRGMLTHLSFEHENNPEIRKILKAVKKFENYFDKNGKVILIPNPKKKKTTLE